MAIEQRGVFAPDEPWMCNRCFQATSVIVELVEDGDEDDEQYVCEACAAAVAAGEPLGRLRLLPVPPGTVH